MEFLHRSMSRSVMAGLWLAVAGHVGSAVQADEPPSAREPERAEVRVGIQDGEFQGADHRALQAAVDYVANLGGGTVHIGPGRYSMRNALTLRDNVRILGTPGKTILVACDGLESKLSVDGDCNERQITVDDPAGFQVGDGVSIQDKRYGGGFEVTTATLTARVDANTFRISSPLYLDYLVSNNATARLTFPVVGGWQVGNVVLEGLTVEGNREKAQHLNGCRGGGIFLFECESVVIRNCTVRGYNGDGISFQVSQHVTVEDCVSQDNAGIGIHPGSGSGSPVVRRNRSSGNGQDGLYVCWRVKHGHFEANELCDNQRDGISIGHKDTDNLFVRNVSTGNGAAGLHFRNESEPMGAHRNVFEENRILDNGEQTQGNAPRAAVVIRGYHHDLVFRRNVIGNSSAAGESVGILVSESAKNLTLEDNEFLHVQMKSATRK
jgi:hypothetical protein